MRCRGDRTAAGGRGVLRAGTRAADVVISSASATPGLASSVHVGAFNLGNGFGAALGGLVIKLGLGYAALSVAGASIVWPTRLLVSWSVWPVRRAAAPACC